MGGAERRLERGQILNRKRSNRFQAFLLDFFLLVILMDNPYFIQDTFFNEKLLMCPLKRSQCVSREEERPRGTPRLIEK